MLDLFFTGAPDGRAPISAMNPSEIISTEIHTRAPVGFTAEEKRAFMDLVTAAGEVDPEGLPERLEAALRLTFMYAKGKELCGVAALKQQPVEYRTKVFQKAETSDPAANFPYELGWIVVKEKFRGHRLSHRLVDTALRTIEKAGAYATVRLSNEPMRRTLIRYGFRPEGTHFRSTRGPYDLALYVRDGEHAPAYLSPNFTVRGQYHGSPVRFPAFSSEGLRSLGFHFGDIAQALDFAKESGFIYKADLTFKQLLDIESDWGWTSAPLLAFALHTECLTRGIPFKREDFEPFLGPHPWSSFTLERRKGISREEQLALVQLFQKYGFDGVRYPNHFEPHDSLRRIAYFVTDPSQITVRENRDAKDFLAGEVG